MVQCDSIFQKPSASYLLVTAMDKPAFVSYASSNPTYAVMETSGTLNLGKNIMHLFSN